MTQGSLVMFHSGTHRLIKKRHAHTHTQTNTSYPVMESRRPVWSFWEVVDSIVTSVTWIQEQTDVLDVVLYRRFHPLCWEGHDYTHKQTIAEETCLTSKVHLFVIMLNSDSDILSHHFHFTVVSKELPRMSFFIMKNQKVGSMDGTTPTCYSGGDVWNIQVPFGIAEREIKRTLMKEVGIQLSREEKTESGTTMGDFCLDYNSTE